MKQKLTNKEAIDAWLCKHDVPHIYTINDDLTVDFHGNLNLSYKRITHLPFQIGTVEGTMDVYRNKFTSFEGFPKIIEGSFWCNENQFSSFDNFPTVMKNINCSDNLFTSFKNCPVEIFGNFTCSNNKIESLEFSPRKIYGNFDITGNQLKQEVRYEQLPKIIDGIFGFNDSTFIEQIPKEITTTKELKSWFLHKDMNEQIPSKEISVKKNKI